MHRYKFSLLASCKRVLWICTLCSFHSATFPRVTYLTNAPIVVHCKRRQVNTNVTLSPTSFLGGGNRFRMYLPNMCLVTRITISRFKHRALFTLFTNDTSCHYTNRLFICQLWTSRQTAVTILLLLSKRLWCLCLASRLPTVGGKQKSTTYWHNQFFKIYPSYN